MSLFSILALVSGIIASLAGFFQAIKIFRRKSAKDISQTAYSVWLATSVIWLFYGFEINDQPIVITSALGIASIVPVMIGRVMYG